MAVAMLSPASLRRPRAQGSLVAALDVGTSKVAAIIAALDPDGPPRMLGAGIRASSGLRRGLVADMERTEQAIRSAMEQAERSAGVEAEAVLVNLSAGALESSITSVEMDIAGHRIGDDDLAQLLAAGRQRVADELATEGRTALHAEPALYTIDGLDGVTNPRGFHANSLAVDIHVVTAATPSCRNLDLAVRHAHLGVSGLVASAVAASEAVLFHEERQLGVALVELGAGVTTVAVHAEGMLVGLASIAMGAGDVTDDIASTFATRRQAAERLKTLSGAAIAIPRDNHDMVSVPGLHEEEEPRAIARTEIIAVIRQRLERLFREVATALDDMGFRGPAGRQVVLTGGGAELRGIADFAAGALGRSVRVGRPAGLAGLAEAHNHAAFATLVGLVLHGARERIDLARFEPPRRSGVRAPALGGAIGRLFHQLRRQI